MRFRPTTINHIARCICGDDPLPFPYRTGKDLSEFFGGLGLDFRQQGQSRNDFARAALTSINLVAPKEDNLPSPQMISIIEELMSIEYFNGSSQERVNYREALDRINTILSDYALEIVLPRPGGLAQLRQSDGNYVSSALMQYEATRKITFCPSVFKIPMEVVARDLVAVMMPFAAHFSPVYEAIGAACCLAKLRCQRADDIWKDSTIIQDIFHLIFTSTIVIVDFTEKNPNVMYETGIAHTLGKHVVPITQSMDDVPFDLKQHRVLKYLPNTEGLNKLQSSLSRRLTTIIDQNYMYASQDQDRPVSGGAESRRAAIQNQVEYDDIPF